MGEKNLCLSFTIMLALAEISFGQSKIQPLRLQALHDSTTNAFLRRAKITSQKDQKLKEIGVNLRDYLSKNAHGITAPDEKDQAAMSDLVFVGKVLDVVDMPAPSAFPFHSKVNVQVLEVLKGPEQQEGTIQLLRQSGTITDVPPPKRRPPGVPANAKVTISRTVTTDPTYKVGETSVFFADSIEGDPYLATVYKSVLSTAVERYPKPSYFVMSGGKFEIIDSLVVYFGHAIPLGQFTSDIRQVTAILDRP